MNQQGEDDNTQIRSCLRCSVVQPTQVRRTTEYAAEQQDPRGGASTIAPDNVLAGVQNPQVTVSANIFSHVFITKLLGPGQRRWLHTCPGESIPSRCGAHPRSNTRRVGCRASEAPRRPLPRRPRRICDHDSSRARSIG